MAFLDTIDDALRLSQPQGQEFRITSRNGADRKTAIMDCAGAIISEQGVTALARTADRAIDAGAVNLVFNMQSLRVRPDIRPSLLGSLIRIFSTVNRSGGSVSLVQPEALREILPRTRMDIIFRIHESEQQALAAIAPANKP